jgi:hypothetical protein
VTHGCVYPNKVCPDTDICHRGQCTDATTGTCIVYEVPGCCFVDGDCNDGNPATRDTCSNNNCLHAGSCDDGNLCTRDFQDITTGDCTHELGKCYDHDPCTTDTCDPLIGCVYTVVPGCNGCASNADCDDGLTCTFDHCNPNYLPTNLQCNNIALWCPPNEVCREGEGCVVVGP